MARRCCIAWISLLACGLTPAQESPFGAPLERQLMLPRAVCFRYSVRGWELVSTIDRAPMTVSPSTGDWLRVESPTPGWVRRQDVLPLRVAIGYYSDRIEDDPQAGWPWAMRALAKNADRRADYIEDLEAAAERLAQPREILTWLAMIYRGQGYNAKASTALDRVLERWPDDPAALELRGLMQLSDGDTRAAQETLERVLELDPRRTSTRQWLASLHYRARRFAKSVELITEALEYDDDRDGSLHADRGVYYLVLGEFTKSGVDGNTALQRGNRDPDAYLARGVSYCRGSKVKQGLADLEEVLRQRPDDTYALRYRASALSILERYEDALPAFDQVLRQTPDNEWALTQRGHCHFELRHWEQSIADLTAALRLQRESSKNEEWLLDARAAAYRALGQDSQAVADLQQLAKRYPDGRRGPTTLAWHLVTTDNRSLYDPYRALKYAYQACRATKFQSAEAVLALAAALAATGDFHSARRWTERSIELSEHQEHHDYAERMRKSLARRELPIRWAGRDRSEALPTSGRETRTADAERGTRNVELRRVLPKRGTLFVGPSGLVHLDSSRGIVLPVRGQQGEWLRVGLRGWGVPATAVVDIEDAVGYYSEHIDSGRDVTWALLQRGRAHLTLGNKRLASADFRRAARSPTQPAFALQELVASQYGLNNTAALRTCERLLERAPEDAETHLLYAWVLYGERRYEESMASLAQAQRLDPHDARATILSAILALAQERFDDLSAEIDRLRSYWLHLGDAHALKADQLWAQEQAAAALQEYDRALAIDPTDTAVRIRRARCRFEQSDTAGALADLEIVIQLRPASIDPRRARSSFRAAQGDYDGARADLDEALRLEPGEAELYTERGWLNYRQGRATAALADLTARLLLDDDSEAHLMIAWIRATSVNDPLRHGKQALEHARRACQLMEDHPRALLTLSVAQAESGDFEAARATLDRIAAADREGHYQGFLRHLHRLYLAGIGYRDERNQMLDSDSA